MDIKYWHRISKEKNEDKFILNKPEVQKRLFQPHNLESSLIYFQGLDEMKSFSEIFKILMKENILEIEEEVKKGNIVSDVVISYIEKYRKYIL